MTDPSLWATLAGLTVAGWLAATLSGAAGFGGALILLPILSGILGVNAAVAVLTIAQIWGNASRVWFGRRVIAWRPVVYFSLAAVPLSMLGSLLFVEWPTRYLTVGIGLFLLVIIAVRRIKSTAFTLRDRDLWVGGALTGFSSGLAGSAGPLGAPFFLALELPAGIYIASEAVTALAIHLTKSVVFQRFALIGWQELGYGLWLGVAMVAGSWTGKKIIERLPRERFILLVEVLMVVSALQLIFLQ